MYVEKGKGRGKRKYTGEKVEITGVGKRNPRKKNQINGGKVGILLGKEMKYPMRNGENKGM